MTHVSFDQGPYSLTGESARHAFESGLTDAEWFSPAIDFERLRSLHGRSNARAGVDMVVWLVLLIGTGVIAYASIWSWWSIPAFAVYGALYGGSCDARWHECGHGTAFRSRRLNDLIYYLASFMCLRGPTLWRWSHYRHHTDTLIVGRDPEIAVQRPPSVRTTILMYTNVLGAWAHLKRHANHARGRLDSDALDFVPASEQRKVVWESRVFLVVLSAVSAWSIGTLSIVPLMFIGLPSVYGGWLIVFFGITQHAGMTENVLDHRLSGRTVKMNPLFRFLYLNMNYHVEHHLFPSVPYRALPRLHDEIGDQLPVPCPSVISAYREIFRAIRRQHVDPTWEIPRDLPIVPEADRRPIDFASWVRRSDGLIDLGISEEIGVGELRRVDIGEETFVLGRLDDGQLILCDGICPHEHAHLSGGLILDEEIECPKHNGRVNALTGEPTRSPVRAPLCTYGVREDGGQILTDLKPRHSSEGVIGPKRAN